MRQRSLQEGARRRRCYKDQKKICSRRDISKMEKRNKRLYNTSSRGQCNTVDRVDTVFGDRWLRYIIGLKWRACRRTFHTYKRQSIEGLFIIIGERPNRFMSCTWRPHGVIFYFIFLIFRLGKVFGMATGDLNRTFVREFARFAGFKHFPSDRRLNRSRKSTVADIGNVYV